MAQAVGLGAAIEYLSSVGMDIVNNHERTLTEYLLQKLNSVDDLSIVGPNDSEARGSAVSFTVNQIHPHDLGQYLDSQGIAVRTGQHCAWPLAKRMGVPASTRASLYLYNNEADCDALFNGILGAQKYFGSF